MDYGPWWIRDAIVWLPAGDWVISPPESDGDDPLIVCPVMLLREWCALAAMSDPSGRRRYLMGVYPILVGRN
jgi:hypothetical protein